MDLSLGYIGIESARSADWRDFTALLGFGVRDEPSDTLFLTMDAVHHRLAVHPGEREALKYVGWEVRREEDIDLLTERLRMLRIDVEEASVGDCEARFVNKLVRLTDPCGVRHEIYAGPLQRPVPEPMGRAMAGHFVTGDMGLGHIVLAVPDAAAQRALFTKGLDFRKSDGAGAAGVSMEFLRCNRRHHSIAWIEFPETRGLLHIMVEVSALDDVGIALDLLRENGHPIVSSLGRHHNDRAVSFYARTPSGFDIEYGWGPIQVDEDAWSEGQYDTPSLWGHVSDPSVPGEGMCAV